MQLFPVGSRLHEDVSEACGDGVHCVDGAEDVWVFRGEVYGPVSSHVVAEDSAGFTGWQGAVFAVDVGYELLNHEVSPVSCNGGVEVEGSADGGIEVGAHYDDFVDHAAIDRLVEIAFALMVPEEGILVFEETVEVVENRVAFGGRGVVSRQVDLDVSGRADVDLGAAKVL